MNCYLLAGGESRRMGRSKVELFGAAMVQLAGAVFDAVVVVQRRGPPRIDGVETIYDVAPSASSETASGAAMLGVLAALRHAREPCFILAIDYPLLTADLLRDLRQQFEASGASLLVPEWQGEPQLLCAGYGMAMRAVVEAEVAAGRFALRPLLQTDGAEIIAEQELRARFPGEPLLNVNTPAEWREAESIDGRS